MRVKMNEVALENYGEQYRDVIFEVTHIATKYMPAKEFFEKNRPNGYHPGYDESMNGSRLYDLKRVDTGENLGFSLYNWELKHV